MKSISFNNARKCERIRDVKPGQRFATVRMLNIPTYVEGEIVQIKDKRHPRKYRDVFGKDITEEGTKILYLAAVKAIHFKRVRDLTKEDAALDLFPEKSAEDFQSEILMMYDGRTADHYCVQTVLERCGE